MSNFRCEIADLLVIAGNPKTPPEKAADARAIAGDLIEDALGLPKVAARVRIATTRVYFWAQVIRDWKIEMHIGQLERLRMKNTQTNMHSYYQALIEIKNAIDSEPLTEQIEA